MTDPVTPPTEPIGEIVPVSNPSEYELEQVKEATKALVEALKRLAETQIATVSNLPKEVSQNVEQKVKEIQTEADKTWQTVVQQVGEIDDRVIRASKAAWEILSAPPEPPHPPDGKNQV
ncbi:MAG: hypothetical protein KME35_20560 [Aphanocapsa sp. GSE-SYN-MK-11-07L]|jgi:nucleotide-binding universal stress UspA family protein|nr:hypothetical protein [Aphanocapsa sp. GSE-SYN-MK-11-07L]